VGDRLKGRVAIVTGSGQGIGRAIAIAMAKEGAMVVTNDYEPGIAESVAKEIVDGGGQAIAFVGDITDYGVSRRLAQTAVDSFGRLDILVNNAGIVGPGWFWDMTEETWDRVVAVSLKGSFNCSRHACNIMKEQGWGRIISASSNSAFGALETAAYCAAKAGVTGLTRALARELGPYGITCNAYAPSAGTRLTLSDDVKERFRKRYEAGVYTKERYENIINPSTPEIIAPLIVYLSTDEAADINGQLFRIDGNRVALFSESLEVNSIDKKEGLWTIDELVEMVPKVVLKGYNNPAPATR